MSTHLKIWGVGVWWGTVWQEIEGGTPPMQLSPALPLVIPILDRSQTFDMSFYKFIFACGQ